MHDAYAAGFFDGEGSVSISQRIRVINDKEYSSSDLWVSITQIRPAVLEQIAAQYGGRVYERQARATKSGEKHRRWDLVITSLAAAKFLRIIRPHLIVKADEVDIALRFYDTFEWYKDVGRRGGVPRPVQDERIALIEEMRIKRMNDKAIAYG